MIGPLIGLAIGLATPLCDSYGRTDGRTNGDEGLGEMTRAVESDARGAEKQAVIAELEGWAERLHHLAMAHGACALEAAEDDEPGLAAKQDTMAGTYGHVSEMVSRRVAEVRADGWDGPL